MYVCIFLYILISLAQHHLFFKSNMCWLKSPSSSWNKPQFCWSRPSGIVPKANDVKSTCTSCPIFPRKPLMIPLFLSSCKTFLVCFCCWEPLVLPNQGVARSKIDSPGVPISVPEKVPMFLFVYNELANITSVWTNHHDHHFSGGCDFDTGFTTVFLGNVDAFCWPSRFGGTWRHTHLAVLKFVQIYPLVNVYIAVENHHFLAG